MSEGMRKPGCELSSPQNLLHGCQVQQCKGILFNKGLLMRLLMEPWEFQKTEDALMNQLPSVVPLGLVTITTSPF